MVSWQPPVPPSASCLSRPAICCGDQPAFRRSVTCARKLSSTASLRRRCRRRRGQVLGVQREVAAEAAVAVAEAVAPQLPIDGRGMTAEPGGDLADRGAGLDQAEEGAALVDIDLAVGPGQGRLRRANPRKGWGFALRDRPRLCRPTSPSNRHYGKRWHE